MGLKLRIESYTTNPSAMQPSSSAAPIVLIVDDDELVLKSIDSLVRSAGYRSALYASAVEFLSKPLPEGVRCLVADVRLPLVSGLDLQAELAKRGERVPILFITGHGDIPMSVRAMKAGAVDFLSKPFRDQDIMDAIACALTEDIRLKEMECELESLRARYESLTSREREVLRFVSSGLLNKQVASELGLSEITVKLHRGSAMRKMCAQTLAQVVRMMEAIERGTLQNHTPV
jgi:FixJ family two-component response regulator